MNAPVHTRLPRNPPPPRTSTAAPHAPRRSAAGGHRRCTATAAAPASPAAAQAPRARGCCVPLAAQPQLNSEAHVSTACRRRTQSVSRTRARPQHRGTARDAARARARRGADLRAGVPRRDPARDEFEERHVTPRALPHDAGPELIALRGAVPALGPPASRRAATRPSPAQPSHNPHTTLTQAAATVAAAPPHTGRGAQRRNGQRTAAHTHTHTHTHTHIHTPSEEAWAAGGTRSTRRRRRRRWLRRASASPSVPCAGNPPQPPPAPPPAPFASRPAPSRTPRAPRRGGPRGRRKLLGAGGARATSGPGPKGGPCPRLLLSWNESACN